MHDRLNCHSVTSDSELDQVLLSQFGKNFDPLGSSNVFPHTLNLTRYKFSTLYFSDTIVFVEHENSFVPL